MLKKIKDVVYWQRKKVHRKFNFIDIFLQNL